MVIKVKGTNNHQMNITQPIAILNQDILGQNLVQLSNPESRRIARTSTSAKQQTFHNTPTKVGNSYFAVELNFLAGTRIVQNLEWAWTLKTKIARCQQESKSQKGISDSQNKGYMEYKSCFSSEQSNAPQTLVWSTDCPLGRPWSAPRSLAATPSHRHHQPTESKQIKNQFY